MERVHVIAALKRRRFGIRDRPVLSDRMDQLSQSKLAVLERLSDAVFNDPALQINRLPCWWRQIDAYSLQNLLRPTLFLEGSPKPFSSRSPGGLQLVQQVLEFLRSYSHSVHPNTVVSSVTDE
jgi:hypothetical protein